MALMKTALITGSNGFLGRHLAIAFLANGFEVRGLGTARSSRSDGITYKQVDLTEPSFDRAIFDGVDLVIHAAGVLPGSGGDLSLNHLITENTIDCLNQSKAPHLVHISSAAVYGSRPGERREDDDLRPDNAYGESKLSCERLVEGALAVGKVSSACIVRPANIFGPDMSASNNLLRMGNAIAQRRFLGLGKGLNRKSLLHIEDAVSACLLAADRHDDLQIFNVATGELAMRDVTATIASALNAPSPRWLTALNPTRLSVILGKPPLSPINALGRSIATFGSTDVLDDSRIREIGFSPPTDIRGRIDQTFDPESKLA